MEHEHGHESLIESVKENLSFILVALVIIAAIMILAKLIENLVIRKEKLKKTGMTAKKIAGIGVFSALGGALALLEIPLPFVPGFYLLDFSEIAGMMAAFLLGPVAGVLVEFIKTILHILIHGTHSAFVGDFAAFVLGSIYVLPAALIYLVRKSKKGAIIGLLAATLSLIVCGAIFNGFYLIPKFAKLYGMPIEAIVAMGTAINPAIKNIWTLVAFATVPFNILKGVAVSLVVFLIYKPLSNLYRKIG